MIKTIKVYWFNIQKSYDDGNKFDLYLAWIDFSSFYGISSKSEFFFLKN